MLNYEYLDSVVAEVQRDHFAQYDVLSGGQRLYVALASNRPDLLTEEGVTLAKALKLIDAESLSEITQRYG